MKQFLFYMGLIIIYIIGLNAIDISESDISIRVIITLIIIILYLLIQIKDKLK